MSFQISADDTKSNPMKAVSGVQDLISTWDTHNLWAQMSPDHFWSAVLLRSLNSHALFRDVLQKTQEFIRTHEHDPPSGRLPIFTYTSTYIQNLQSDKTFNSGKPTSTSDKPPYPGRSTHNQYKSQSLPAGVEQAAAATAPTVPAKTVSIAATPTSGSTATRPTPSTTSSTGGPNPRTNPKGKTIYSTPIKTYQGPVHKGHKVFIDTHSPPNHPDNRPFRYLAVPHRTDVCEKCFATEPTPLCGRLLQFLYSLWPQVVPLHATFLLRGGKRCCQALTSEAVQCHFCCGCRSSSQYARTNCAGTGLSLSPDT